MSFEKHAEERIREAIDRGDFDDLPGKGAPLNLDAYFATPEHLRMGYVILKNAGIIPEEMELLKEIDRLRRLLDSENSNVDKAAIQRKLSDKLTSFNLRMENLKRRRS